MATASEPMDFEQGMLFDAGLPERAKPSDAEVQEALHWAVKLAINKQWRGLPPKGWTWEDLYQAVTLGALRRLKNFRHGGKVKLRNFSYLACCYELLEIGRSNVRRSREETAEPKKFPLLDRA